MLVLVLVLDLGSPAGTAASKWKIEDEQLTYYAEDGETVLRRFNLFDKKGNPTNLNPYERVPA